MIAPINRRDFLNAAIAASALHASSKLFSAPPERPNILFLFADDLGYGDLSCYGRPDYKTPVLDKLAADGMKFTDTYAIGPTCTPTRAGFHTGRYPQRVPVGAGPTLGDNRMDLGLSPEHPTVSSLLKANGYENILIGKWNMGNNIEKFGPNRHGYDEFFGINGAGADYFSHINTANRFDLYDNTEPSKEQGYLTDLFTERAVKVIKRTHTKPFYISLHYNAPHYPWDGPGDADDARLDHKHTARGASDQEGNGSPSKFGEMVKSMDAGIGRVLKALADAKLDRKTLVIFTSDNGGERYSFNWPFAFQKGFLWEGGIRVPSIVRWPGVVPAGKVTSQAATTMDWSATILAATGSKADPQYPLDGESLLSVCTGEQAVHDRTLFWRHPPRIAGQKVVQNAMRMGRWKYLKEEEGEHLFDLVADPGEKRDLKTANREMFDALKAKYKTWVDQLLPIPGAS